MNVVLRPWKITDLDSVVQYGCNPAVCSYMSDGFPDTREKWTGFLRKTVGNTDVLYRALTIDDLAVGGIGVSPLNDIYRKNGELGYWLGEPYWNGGVMTGAVREMVRLAFSVLSVDRIFAVPFSTNHASHRVLQKAGFVLEARFEKMIIKNGEMLDQLVYATRRTVSS